jgi:hypothetical protein
MNVTLAVAIVSPGHDGAVSLEAQAVVGAGVEGHEVGVGPRHVTLPCVVTPPGCDGAIGPEAKAVPASSSDRDEAAVRRLNQALQVPSISPEADGAAGLGDCHLHTGDKNHQQMRCRKSGEELHIDLCADRECALSDTLQRTLPGCAAGERRPLCRAPSTCSVPNEPDVLGSLNRGRLERNARANPPGALGVQLAWDRVEG